MLQVNSRRFVFCNHKVRTFSYTSFHFYIYRITVNSVLIFLTAFPSLHAYIGKVSTQALCAWWIFSWHTSALANDVWCPLLQHQGFSFLETSGNLSALDASAVVCVASCILLGYDHWSLVFQAKIHITALSSRLLLLSPFPLSLIPKAWLSFIVRFVLRCPGKHVGIVRAV